MLAVANAALHAADPVVIAYELSGLEAARAALVELAEADALRVEDEAITREYCVPRYTRDDFDPCLIEALVALESGRDDDVFFDEPERSCDAPEDARILQRLLEPYVDFATLAAMAG